MVFSSGGVVKERERGGRLLARSCPVLERGAGRPRSMRARAHVTDRFPRLGPPPMSSRPLESTPNRSRKKKKEDDTFVETEPCNQRCSFPAATTGPHRLSEPFGAEWSGSGSDVQLNGSASGPLSATPPAAAHSGATEREQGRANGVRCSVQTASYPVKCVYYFHLSLASACSRLWHYLSSAPLGA